MVEAGRGGGDFAVGLAGGADDELGGLLAPGIELLAQAGDIFDGGNNVFVEPFSLREVCEALGIGGFDVDGDTSGQADRLFDGGGAGARQDLEVDKAAKLMSAAYQLDRSEHTVHGLVGLTGNAGGEEQAADAVGVEHVDEGAGQFVGADGGTGQVAAGIEGAIGAVVGAGVGL